MTPQAAVRDVETGFRYDPDEDALHVELEPYPDDSTCMDHLEGRPDYFKRCAVWNSRCVGIAVKPLSRHLRPFPPTDAALRRLAEKIVAEFADAGLRGVALQKSRALAAAPGVTWTYAPFAEILYVDLEPNVDSEISSTDAGHRDINLRRARDDDRIVGLFECFVTRNLGTDMPTEAQLAQLAADLVARFAPSL